MLYGRRLPDRRRSQGYIGESLMGHEYPERPVQAGQKKELSVKKLKRASLRAAFTRAACHPSSASVEFAVEAQSEVVLAEGS